MVSGCGPIGLFAVAAARAMTGARIVAVDPSAARRRLAAVAGADVTCAPDDLADQPPCDAVIETSGVAPALAAAFAGTRKGGRVVYCGLPSTPLPVDISGQIVLREIALVGIYGRHLTRTWEDMSRLLTEGGLDITPLLAQEFPLARFADALALARGGDSGKVLFDLTAP